MHRLNDSDETRSRFSTLTKYFKRYRRYLWIGGLAVLFSNIFILVVPYVSKLVFDALQQHKPMSLILKFVILSFFLALFSGLFRFVMRRTIIWMSRYIEYDLRGEIFAHLLRLTPSFYHQRRTGDLMARMTNDLEAVRQMVGPGIMYISDTVVKLTVAFGFMIYLSPTLTLYAIIPLVVMPIAVNRIGNVIHRRFMRVQESFSELTAAAQENLSGIRVVKAYRQEQPEIEHFSGLSDKNVELNMSLARLQGIFVPSMRLIAAISYLVVFYFGGLQIIHGTLGLGDIVAFFGYLSMITWPMIAIGWVTSLYQRGTASLGRINSILFSDPIVANAEDRRHAEAMRGEIEFKNLKFAYNGTPVLKDINLKIDAGQTVGLIGMTGSGKTTVISLLSHMFPIERGQVLIDGVDINDWDLSHLRSQIGVATQEPFLFSDTIEGNIRFGRLDATLDEVIETAGIADLSKDIDEFREGYETIVGERGITLSGGQKQRTAIARAIITKPAILVLDDATSAVDTETEHQINERIKQVLAGRTAIIISHRVSSVKEADMIVYLHDGTISEQGTHDELMALNGHYAELYRSQLLEMELESL